MSDRHETTPTYYSGSVTLSAREAARQGIREGQTFTLEATVERTGRTFRAVGVKPEFLPGGDVRLDFANAVVVEVKP